MSLQIKFKVDDKSVKGILRIYSGDTNHSSHKGFQDYIYIFPIRNKFPDIFKS